MKSLIIHIYNTIHIVKSQYNYLPYEHLLNLTYGSKQLFYNEIRSLEALSLLQYNNLKQKRS